MKRAGSYRYYGSMQQRTSGAADSFGQKVPSFAEVFPTWADIAAVSMVRGEGERAVIDGAERIKDRVLITMPGDGRVTAAEDWRFVWINPDPLDAKPMKIYQLESRRVATRPDELVFVAFVLTEEVVP